MSYGKQTHAIVCTTDRGGVDFKRRKAIMITTPTVETLAGLLTWAGLRPKIAGTTIWISAPLPRSGIPMRRKFNPESLTDCALLLDAMEAKGWTHVEFESVELEDGIEFSGYWCAFKRPTPVKLFTFGGEGKTRPQAILAAVKAVQLEEQETVNDNS